MSLLAGLSQQGDSIAAHNGDAAAHGLKWPTTIQWDQIGDSRSTMSVRASTYSWFGYMQAALRSALVPVGQGPGLPATWGYAGYTTAQILAAAPHVTVAAGPANIVLIDAFVNDAIQSDVSTDAARIAVAAAGFTNIRTMAEYLVAAGKTVILSTVYPLTTAVSGYANKNLAIRRYNALIRAYATTSRGIVLDDSSLLLCDIAGSDALLATHSSDGIHLNQLGNSVLGVARASVVRNLMRGSPVSESRFLPAVSGDGVCLSVNPMLRGSCAASGTGISGNKPTNTTIYAQGGGTIVSSVVARTDGIPGQWWQLELSAANLETDGVMVQLDSVPVANFAVGDKLAAVCEIEQAEGVTFRALELDVVAYASASPVATNYWGGKNERTKGLARIPVGVLSTPTGVYGMVVPQTTTAAYLFLYVYGAGTLRIGRVGIMKVG